MSTSKYLSLNCPPAKYENTHNFDTKWSTHDKISDTRTRVIADAARTSGQYSDATVYNKFQQQTQCVWYLDAPILCVTLSPILQSSRIPDTYKWNYEICKQTRCNGGCDGRVFSSSRVFSNREDPSKREISKCSVGSIRRRIPTSKIARQITRASCGNLSRAQCGVIFVEFLCPGFVFSRKHRLRWS